MEKKVLFHSFFTDEYSPWAELYLESINLLYGSEISIRLDGVNITDKNAKILNNIHRNIDLHINNIDYCEVANSFNIDCYKFIEWKNEIERGDVNETNYLYKIFISVNQRYRNMYKVINDARSNGFDYVIHSDIDLYFRKKFNGLFKIMERNDFAAFYRNEKNHNLKILGAFLVFNLKNDIDIFIDKWMEIIDSVPFLKRWKGFGQSALWMATENTKSKTKIVDLSTCKNAPNYSKNFDINADIWLNSNSNYRYPIKGLPRIISWEDLKSRMPQIESFDRKKNVIVVNGNEVFVSYKFFI